MADQDQVVVVGNEELHFPAGMSDNAIKLVLKNKYKPAGSAGSTGSAGESKKPRTFMQGMGDVLSHDTELIDPKNPPESELHRDYEEIKRGEFAGPLGEAAGVGAAMAGGKVIGKALGKAEEVGGKLIRGASNLSPTLKKLGVKFAMKALPEPIRTGAEELYGKYGGKPSGTQGPVRLSPDPLLTKSRGVGGGGAGGTTPAPTKIKLGGPKPIKEKVEPFKPVRLSKDPLLRPGRGVGGGGAGGATSSRTSGVTGSGPKLSKLPTPAEESKADLAAAVKAEAAPERAYPGPEGAPETGAKVPKEHYKAAARTVKAKALARYLKIGGISPQDAARMDAGQWNLAAQGAGVTSPSEQSVKQALSELEKLYK